MYNFYSKVVRVNEMGGKFYVEIKTKAFEKGERDTAAIDDVEVKVFDTAETASKFLDTLA